MLHYLHNKKVEIIALLVLVPLTVVLGAILVRHSSLKPAATISSPPTGEVTQQLAAPASTIEARSPGSTMGQVAQTVTIEIVGRAGTDSYSVAMPNETITVAELLRHAEDTTELTITTKDYGGSLGIFVEAINGVANDPAQELYWHLYINGQRSPTGASATHIRSGDTVRWTYERMSEQE